MHPPIPVASPERGPSETTAGKVWRVGTLSYTSSALIVLFCWLLWGDFAWQLKERAAPPVVQLMLSKFHASDFLTGLFLLSLPAAMGVLFGSIISYRSDRHRGSWGRRIPYLLITSPIAAFSMYGLALSPWIGSWLHARLGWAPENLNVTIITVLGLSWTLFEFASVTSNAVFGGLINDVVPSHLIGRFFGMFRVVSLVNAMLFNYYLIGRAKEHYMPILLGIGTLYGVGVALMCLMVKEGDYPPPSAAGEGGIKSVVLAVKSYGRDCFSRPYYLWVFASMAVAQMTYLPVNLFSVYAAESYGLSMGAYGKYLFVSYAFSLVMAYPLGCLADRFHAIRITLGALAAYAVVMAVGFFAIKGPVSFGVVFLLHSVLAGCYFTGSAALGQMLFPKMKFAQFASAGGLIFALCSVGLGPVLGMLLDWLGHEYRYTFGLGCLIGLFGLLLNIVVYRRFMALGGPQGYKPPE